MLQQEQNSNAKRDKDAQRQLEHDAGLLYVSGLKIAVSALQLGFLAVDCGRDIHEQQCCVAHHMHDLA
jgi:hypothetical protein